MGFFNPFIGSGEDKVDKSYVDSLVGDINTILASVVGGGS